jgi:hypothetical protein
MAAITEASIEDLVLVVDRFRMGGRTLLMPGMSAPLTPNTVVDISHESLMRIWSRLREWVQEESDSVKMYLRLAEAAEMYQRGTSGLWRPPDLQVAIAWQEKQRPNLTWGLRYSNAHERTMLFLETSRRAYDEEQRGKERLQKKRLQRTRLVALALGLAAIVSASFLVYARLQTQQAEANFALAKAQEARALTNQEAADKERKNALDKAEEAQREKIRAEEAKIQAEEAKIQAEQARIAAEKSAIEAKNQQKQAEISAKQAKQAQAEAENQKSIALLNEQKAKQQQERAEREEESAKKLRFMALAQSLSVKSLQLDDSTQKALVARQAFLFNKEYNNNALDPDVYAGLYSAQKTVEGPKANQLLEGGHKNAVQAIAFFKNSLYTSGSDGALKQWDMKAGKASDLNQSFYIYKTMCISPQGDVVALGTDEGPIQLLSAKTQSLPVLLEGHAGGVWEVAFADNGQQVVSIGADNTLKMQAVQAGGTPTVIAKLSEAPRAMLLKGKEVLVLTKKGKLLKFPMQANASAQTLLEQSGEAGSALALHPNGKLLAIGFESGQVMLYDLEKQQRQQRITAHTAVISQLAFSHQGKYLATASFDHQAMIWKEGQYNTPVLSQKHASWVWSVCFTPADDELLVGCLDGSLNRYPLNMQQLADKIGAKVSRRLTLEEWEQFVGKDVPFEQ